VRLDGSYFTSGGWVSRWDLPQFTDVDRGWMERGACRRSDIPIDLFFPGRGDRDALRAAKAVCGSCPVTAECLTYALDMHERDGVWGGLSGRERRNLRRRRATS
jgi:WhiB family redox-sensing transcriptional regulator